ncbi:hypothetical protein EMPS_01104 [Entomortierella parvispora]|uniref:Uncharacterized protein n=1 Tax=Entomortierella parvispora TaxID=205924 RepID=A0A9P3H2Y0_9FUNG|nr:hypothetical protein EMPS_01104 [Entomortierella parvispora]
MTFFKLNGTSSKKNKTASVVNTPSQTPRTSVQLNASDVAAVNKANALLNHQETLEMLLQKNAMGHMQAMSMARI